MLYHHYMQALSVLEKTEVRDSEGGTITTWEPAENITGAIVDLQSTVWTAGESQRLSDQYKLYVSRAVELPFHAVIRDSQGNTYRVISTPKKTPESFTGLNLKSYRVERWAVS